MVTGKDRMEATAEVSYKTAQVVLPPNQCD